MSWVGVDDALVKSVWSDAPYDLDVRSTLLEAAHTQCVAFAPPLADGESVPENYRLAEVMQARALHRSFKAGSGDQVGGEFPVTVFPMDWSVKNLLRPAPGIPGIF